MVRSGFQFSSIPFLRLLFPLCLGIWMQQNCTLSGWLSALLLLFLFSAALLFGRKVAYYYQPFWGFLLVSTFFVFGCLRAQQTTGNFPQLVGQRYFVVLDGYPVEKANSFQVVGQIINSDQKMVAYLAKSPMVGVARPGDVFSFEGKPELIQNEGNPFEFDYRRYLNDRGIGYRIFLKENQFQFLKGSRQLNVSRSALIFRSKLIEMLDKSGMAEKNVHLVASISFGARDEVDKETITGFTNTGVIHVLAVSGMNVGLIYVILDFLLRFLKRGRAGRLLHTLIVLSGIWGYALVTGMSASILRAAMMFTFVVIGTVLRRDAGIFNSLAVSAFLLIAWDPAILRDVGFQLSYAAVAAIVVIQPVIYKRLYVKNLLINQIWLLLSVTFAAQIGTLPFTLHYFHQFPVYFWLANLVVIPLVTLILYLSFVVIAVYLLSGFLASLLAHLLDGSVWLVLSTVRLVENFPCAVIRGLYPSFFQLLLAFLAGYLLYRFVRTRRRALLTGALGSAIVVVVSSIVVNYRQLTRTEIIFFNIPGTRALALTSGQKSVVLHDRGEKAKERVGYYLQPYLGKRGLRKVEMHCLTDSLRINNQKTTVVGDFIFFKGLRVYVQPSDRMATPKISPTLCADAVWLSDNKTGQATSRGYPESAVVLYRSSEDLAGEEAGGVAPRKLNVKKAVQLTIRPTLPGSPNKMVCGYFSQEN